MRAASSCDARGYGVERDGNGGMMLAVSMHAPPPAAPGASGYEGERRENTGEGVKALFKADAGSLLCQRWREGWRLFLMQGVCSVIAAVWDGNPVLPIFSA